MESKSYLFNQGDGNSDPLPEEDEETDDDEEDDADHGGEREPSISLLQEIVHYFWSPVQLHMHIYVGKAPRLSIRIDICILLSHSITNQNFCPVKVSDRQETWKMFLFVSGSVDCQT